MPWEKVGSRGADGGQSRRFRFAGTPHATQALNRRRGLGLTRARHEKSEGRCAVCLEPWPCPTPGRIHEEIPAGDHLLSYERRLEARDYLADFFDSEEAFGEPDQLGAAAPRFYIGLAAWIRVLPLTDLSLRAATWFIDPVIEDVDEGRVEGVIYPSGEASVFIDVTPPRGSFARYFRGFTLALGGDFARWLATIEKAAADATWPNDGHGVPEIRFMSWPSFLLAADLRGEASTGRR